MCHYLSRCLRGASLLLQRRRTNRHLPPVRGYPITGEQTSAKRVLDGAETKMTPDTSIDAACQSSDARSLGMKVLDVYSNPARSGARTGTVVVCQPPPGGATSADICRHLLTSADIC
jgi:hypothetical protein